MYLQFNWNGNVAQQQKQNWFTHGQLHKWCENTNYKASSCHCSLPVKNGLFTNRVGGKEIQKEKKSGKNQLKKAQVD